MRKQVLTASLLMAIVSFSAAQVGIGTPTPSGTAVLDLSSTSKGLLVPRMTTENRLSVSGPDDGLLVFDNTTNTFWYFKNASWHELVATGIDNSFQMGDGANYVEIEPDGTVEFIGSASVWNDFVVPTNSAKAGGNAPDWEMFKNNGSGSTGVYTFTFADNASNAEDEIHFTIQLPHDYKEGSAIYPHLHWAPMTIGSGVVTWGMEYTWTDFQGTFGGTVVMTASSDSFSNAPFQHFITAFNSLTPDAGQDNISSVLCVRLFRNSSAGTDNYTGKAALLSFDLHYEANTMGSRTEYTK